MEEWEEKFFWARRKKKTRRAQIASEVLFDEAQSDEQQEQTRPRESDYEDVKPLAEELIDTLVDLLFYADFTIPKLPAAKNKVTYAIWQSGVGCNSSMGSNRELENNRCEVLRLLLTLTGKAIYMPLSKSCGVATDRAVLQGLTSPDTLPVQGVRAITYIATCSDKQIVLTLLCSLLNTVGKSVFQYKLDCLHSVCRLSNTILHHGEFHTITLCGEIPSRFLSFIACSSSW